MIWGDLCRKNGTIDSFCNSQEQGDERNQGFRRKILSEFNDVVPGDTLPHTSSKMEIRRVKEDGEPVQLLWTGGYDSTFRLLQLAIVLKKRVQPHYIIYTDRDSLHAEIAAMEKIKKAMVDEFPHTKDLVLPTIYFGGNDIPEYPDIRSDMDELRKIIPFGSQYHIFAEYSRWRQIPYLELGIYSLRGHFTEKSDFLVRVETETDYWYEFDAQKIADSPWRSFAFARLPLVGENKVKLQDKVRKHGLAPYMSMTWFCCAPKKTIKGLVPCGSCTTCRWTVADGMPERIPLSNRIRSWLIRKVRWQITKLKRFFKITVPADKSSQSPEWKLRYETENAVSTDTGAVCSALQCSRQGSNAEND